MSKVIEDRRKHRRAAAIFVLSAGVVSGSASADIQTVRFDMPQNLGVFGLVWQADYFNPAVEGTVVGARLVVNFDTRTGARPFHDAADILFQHQLATTTLPFWDVRGSDLGWSGTGAFTASLSTTAFNGQPLINEGDLVLWFGRIVSANDSQPVLGGVLANSYWEFDINIVPAPASGVVVLAAGLMTLRRRRTGSTQASTVTGTR